MRPPRINDADGPRDCADKTSYSTKKDSRTGVHRIVTEQQRDTAEAEHDPAEERQIHAPLLLSDRRGKKNPDRLGRNNQRSESRWHASLGPVQGSVADEEKEKTDD